MRECVRESVPEGVCECARVLEGLPEPDRNALAQQPPGVPGECLISVRPVVRAGRAGGDGLWLGVWAERKAT